MDEPEVPLRPLAWAAVAAVLVLVVAALTAFGLLRHWGVSAGSEAGARRTVEKIPEPRLQSAPQLDRAMPPTPAPETRQQLGAALPALQLQDADGSPVDRSVLLASGKPLVLLPAWYRCDTLCGTTAHGALEALADTGLAPNTWRLVVFSVDPSDRPADARVLREVYRGYARFARPAVYAADPPDLHLLTGDTRMLASAIGTASAIEPGGQGYAHGTGLVVVTPDGRVSKYLFGVRFDPESLRAALVEASDGQVGTYAERLLLACSHFDPIAGSRDAAVLWGVRAVALGVLWWGGAWIWRHGKRRGGPA